MSQNTHFMAQCSYFIAQIILLRLKLSNPAHKLFLVCLIFNIKQIEEIEKNEPRKLIWFSIFAGEEHFMV